MADDRVVHFGTDHQLRISGLSTDVAGIISVGTFANPFDLGTTADRTGMQLHFTSAAASGGDVWGLYVQQDLTGGGGGYGLIAKCMCSDDTPADTPHGLYANLHFGSSAGNITGLGCALRTNVFVPDRNLGGTVTALMTEFWCEGTSSDMSLGSLIRFVIDGNGTGKAAVEDSVFLFDIATGTNASGNVVGAAQNEPTWSSSKTYPIRIRANGQVMYLVAFKT